MGVRLLLVILTIPLLVCCYLRLVRTSLGTHHPISGKINRLGIMLLILLFILIESKTMASPQFKAVISTTKSSYKHGEVVELLFELTNMNEQDYYVLKWNTPLEGFRNNYLEVQRDGEVLSYRGIMVKRGNPLPESYLLISAGAHANASVKLSEGYDISLPGNYQVTLNAALRDVKERREGEEFVTGNLNTGLNRVQLSAEPVSFVIDR